MKDGSRWESGEVMDRERFAKALVGACFLMSEHQLPGVITRELGPPHTEVWAMLNDDLMHAWLDAWLSSVQVHGERFHVGVC